MTTYSRSEAAERAGVAGEELDELIASGIIVPGEGDRFNPGDVRRVGLVQSLTAAGIPLDGLAKAMASGALTMDFLDGQSYERFSALSAETFHGFADRTGTPLALVLLIREAAGSAPPSPDDKLREGELPIAEFVAAQVRLGFRPIAIERLMRAYGDSLRRMAETEADWWRTEVILPTMEAGKGPGEIANREFSDELNALGEQAVLGLYHAQQTQTWTSNIIGGFELLLARIGLHTRLERPPAMCFLDITGYTSLTQQRGDEAAADLAGTLARLVQRTSIHYGGRPVKWLGDGVMFYFPNPGPGVVAALDMVDGVSEAGLPPAHVGLHAGPVIFQEGDYYGQTVNVASRIAEYARPGEVLVSQEVVNASAEAGLEFRAIGPVELKGVSGAVHLHAAQRGI